jgi:hypothetical protein
MLDVVLHIASLDSLHDTHTYSEMAMDTISFWTSPSHYGQVKKKFSPGPLAAQTPNPHTCSTCTPSGGAYRVNLPSWAIAQ